MHLHIHSLIINRNSLAKHITLVPQSRVLAASQTNRLLLVPKVEIHAERLNIELEENIQKNELMNLCTFPQKAF